MEIEVPRPEAVATIWLDLSQIRQHAVLEAVDMQRTGVFGLVCFAVLSACHDDDGLVARRRADLMKVDALLQIVRLGHLVADAAIGVDAVNTDARRKIVRDENKSAASIDAVIDRPPAQLYHVAELREFAVAADPKRRQVMLVTRKSRTAGTRGYIEKFPRWAGPRILDAARHFDRAAFGQRIGANIDHVVSEFSPDP